MTESDLDLIEHHESIIGLAWRETYLDYIEYANDEPRADEPPAQRRIKGCI